MAGTTGTEGSGGKLDPEELARLIEQVEANRDQIKDNTQRMVSQALVQLYAQMQRRYDDKQDAAASDLRSEVAGLKELVRDVKSKPVPQVKSPRYKRVLHRGERIQDLWIHGQVNAMVQRAGEKFEEDYRNRERGRLLDKLDKATRKAVSKKTAADIRVWVREGLSAEVDQIEGGNAALRAVTAALLDRADLDQTARYLLTRDNVLVGEFLRVQRKGAPAVYETLAVLEEISSGLAALLKNDKHTGFYDRLVADYGDKHGWDEKLRKAVVKRLTDRFAQQG